MAYTGRTWALLVTLNVELVVGYCIGGERRG